MKNEWLDSTIAAHKRFFGKVSYPHVWDVGSRDGHDAVTLARAIHSGAGDGFFRDARLVAVEPNPPQASFIRETYPSITVFETAVGTKTGTFPLKVYEGDEGAVGSSSLDMGWKPDDWPFHLVDVEVNTLKYLVSGYMVRNPVDTIDIMKIDVEGRSLDVLESLDDYIQAVKVFHIETEKWTGSDRAVMEFMRNNGFLMYDIHEQYGNMPDQVWVNLDLATY